MDSEIKKMILEAMRNAVEPVRPKALDDERLEDAFKTPVCNEDGCSITMPVIWNSYRYGQTPDGIKVLSYKSASAASGLYSRYLDEEAVVWDTSTQELLLYIPDEKCPTVAFKGGRWLCAKKLKAENLCLNIYDVYKELQNKIKDELK